MASQLINFSGAISPIHGALLCSTAIYRRVNEGSVKIFANWLKFWAAISPIHGALLCSTAIYRRVNEGSI